MQPLSKHNKGIKHLLCAIDFLGKYACILPLKDKKGISIVNAFQKVISKSSEAESEARCKPNKRWVDQGREFYRKGFKK